jgi:diguanylate cyclase (GGDEF)-like protein
VGPNSNDELSNLLKRLKEEIIPLFDNAISNNHIIFPNPNLVKCSEVMNCSSTECPLHNNTPDSNTSRCWQIAGTFCSGEPQGTFVQKYGDCRKCEVFKKSCPTIIEEIGEHFNNMLFLMNKQNSKIMEDKERIEKLNKEMLSVLEQLNIKDKEFQEMMITDRLTGLFDRHHLISELDDEIARCHRYGHSLALMMIDIDSFKDFNELYGYKAGDKMLSYAGTLIKKNIRKFDKAFRYSVKKFIVILPETDLTLAYIVAERIRKAFEEKSFSVGNKTNGTREKASGSFSIGISSAFNYTTSNAGVEELISQTIQAVKDAREKGGNMCKIYK